MAVIQFECAEADEVAALEAIKKLGRNPRIFSVRPLPKLPSIQKEFEAHALMIANWIKPRPNQPMRRETLEFVLNGGDTWLDQKGEPDPALRNATGALSKALRKFAQWEDSPLDILCTRQRQVVASGPYKGHYQGTRYVPTRLGERVREILREQGVMKKK